MADTNGVGTPATTAGMLEVRVIDIVLYQIQLHRQASQAKTTFLWCFATLSAMSLMSEQGSGSKLFNANSALPYILLMLV